MADSPYAYYGTIDPEYEALLATMPPPPGAPDDPATSREPMNREFSKAIHESFKDRMPDPSTYTIADHSVPLDNGTVQILVRTITPTAADGRTFPLLYYIHGGGFIVGTIEINQPLATTVAVDLQIAVALVEYRLAPEHPHPIPLMDCVEALKWTLNNASSFRVDISKGYVIAGDSAGASLTASAVHLIRDDPFFHAKQPSGQILHIPCLLDPRAYPEEYKPVLRSLDMTKNMPTAGLGKKFIHDMYEKYLKNSPEDPTASPLLFPSHANLPPVVLQVCGLDLFRDEGILYEKLLKEAGVKTRLHVYQGVPHGFYFVYHQLAVGKKFEKDYKDGLLWLLGGAQS
ncbi:Alpha/Beta hydrolase protein [Cristinia sonorae]|uniref:Alpha/Beta hydrolase protein n=1 Tax=Cristinia sonorae TaxID=1940300 RepID=A0A8K0UN89_9AGAR|nr:Alpha/Beta hydrolase protein [Cristinia sonorae]